MKQGELFGDKPQQPAETQREGTSAPGELLGRDPGGDAPAASDVEQSSDPGDAAARRAAVSSFDSPILLEAGAGTGKTATLVARVVHWCMGPGWDEARSEASSAEPELLAVGVLRGVAAITFSEAAAAEMSTRVAQALSRLQRAASSGEALGASALPPGMRVDALPEDVGVVHERARALRAALDHLDISTIHAFCRRLLAAHPLQAGLDPAFEVDPTFTQLEICVRDVLEDFLAEAWADPVDEDLIALARQRIDPPKLESALVDLVADTGARAADFEVDPLDEQTCDALREDLTAEIATFLAVARPLASGTGNTELAMQAASRSGASLADLPTDPREALATLCRQMQEVWQADTRGWARLKDWGKGKFNKGEGKLVGDAAADVAARAADLRAALEPFFELQPLLLGCARRVVGRVLTRVEAELRRRGIATFADLLVEAERLLREHPEVAARERGRRRQLLVDEFQDTDAVQCEIVTALAFAEDGTLGRTTVFLVGDPKQSIYAWRSADLAAYEILARRVEEAGGQRLALTQNFRSVGVVLEEVERSVAPVMRAVAGVQPSFVALEPARGAQNEGASAAIEFWVSWPQGADGQIAPKLDGRQLASYEVEGRAFATDVATRHARGEGEWKDFALVFRGFTAIEPYLEQLRRRGIPYEVQSDRSYYKRREVIDATALVRTILDPTDQIALVTLLRSPMVGVPDAALLPLWEEGLPGKMLALTRPTPEALEALNASVTRVAGRVPSSIPGIAEIAGWERGLVAALRAVAQARAAFRTEPADEWVEHLRAAFLPDALEAARFLGGYRLANVDRFFREVLRTLEDRSGDVHSVLRSLRSNLAREDRSEAARPSDSAQDAVQVLTIHGSKGLEFRHVYLAQVHKTHGGRTERATLFDRRGSDVAYKLFDAPTPSWFPARRRRAEAEAAERVRLLYVSLTRAADRLVVLGGWPEDVVARRKPWHRALSLLDLFRHRPGAAAAIAALGQCAARGVTEPVVDEFGARWILAATIDDGGGSDEESPAAPLEAARVMTPAGAAEELAALAVARERAARRMSRPYSGRASAEGHTAGADGRAARRFAETDRAPTEPPLGRAAAMAVGTAVHHVLEHLDLEAAVDESLRALASRDELARVLSDQVPTESLERAVERADELVRRAVDHGLVGRLVELREHIVARELAVLLPPPVEGNDGAASDAPVGFVAGAVDLLYRDPTSGELVVADYKTDAVESDSELDERAESYRAQGRVYVEAVRDALGLDAPPRFELWFLHSGRIVALGD